MTLFERYLAEAHGNWEYIPPRDPEILLYDFYFLFRYVSDVNTNDEEFSYALQQGAIKCVNHVGEWMSYALRVAIEGEIEHLDDESNFEVGEKSQEYSDTTEKAEDEEEEETMEDEEEYGVEIARKPPYIQHRMWKTFENPYDQELYRTYKMPYHWKDTHGANENHKIISKMIPNSVEQTLYYEHLFGDYNWKSGYGGKKWAQLAHALYNILISETPAHKAIWIDHAYDLEHNNNTFFDKARNTKQYRYTKEEDWRGASFKWLRHALDWKRDNEDLEGFYYKVSSSLKPIVAYVLKNLHGSTIENFERSYIDKKAQYDKLRAYFSTNQIPLVKFKKGEFGEATNTLMLRL